METEPGLRDLDRIVDAVRGATTILGIAEPPSPWLPPLPDRLDVRSLGSAVNLESVPLGLEDIPTEQGQTPWCWSIADGHLGVAGGGRSGRTSTVLTIAAQLAKAQPSSRLHLYAIGPPSLSALAVLPHVAAVADVDDADHIRLVLDRLAALRLGRRSGLEPRREFGPEWVPGSGSGPSPESRPSPESLSGLGSVLDSGPDPAPARPVLLVDGWERLAAHAHGSLAAELRALLETSSGSGLRVVVTGGRAVLAGQLAGLLGQRLVLALGDPVELALAGIPTRAVPGHQPPGRALDARTHREVQVGWLGPDPGSVLADLTARDAEPTGRPTRAARVRRLPTSLTLPMARHRDGVMVVGVRDGDLEPVGFSPELASVGSSYSDPAGSGRTSALVTLALGFRANGHPVACRLGLGLAPLARSPDGRATTPTRDAVLALGGAQPADLDRVVEARRRHPDLVVLVDDAERLAGLPIEPILLEIARRADEDAGVVIAATTTLAVEGRIGALAADLGRAQTGLVLWPVPGSAVLGVATAGLARPARIPGRGMLVTPRGADQVQVATVSRP